MDSIIVPASKRPFHSIPIPLCDQMLFDEGEMGVRTWWQDTRSRGIVEAYLDTFKCAYFVDMDEDEDEREAPDFQICHFAD